MNEIKKEVYMELFQYVKMYPNNLELGARLRNHILDAYNDLNAEEANPDQGTLDL
jgi:hypothetical protein